MNSTPPEALTLFCLLSIATLGAFALWPLGADVHERSSIIPPRWMWSKTKKDAWIDVKDRMPKAGQRALLRLNNGDAVDVGTWYPASATERAGWHDDTGDFYFVGVTHWQPLPAKEKKR